MARVSIEIPSILASLIGERTFQVEGTSVEHALMRLTRRYPVLYTAIFDESGALREHVLCFHNSENTRWYDQGLQHKLQDGDRLTIVQAVSGG